MPTPDYTATIERFTGFGAQYDQARPSAPDALADLLLPIARCTTPPFVVDVGSGTGLSTRYWSGRARTVIGIEPSDSMRAEAERVGGDNVSYRHGYSHATGLDDGVADLVICAQSLHWMEPESTFAEATRILRPGGLFAAYDYDWPPSTSYWEVDQVYMECMEIADRLGERHRIMEGVQRWKKSGHLMRMRDSGRFRFVREALLHHCDEGSAERVVGVFLSQGHVQSLIKRGVTGEELGVDRLLKTARHAWGETKIQWFWSARVRMALR
jgi:SAM-dependent methyltransferase